MGNAQQGEDAQHYFAANLGRTRRLVAGAVAVQIEDVDGKLVAGRYLLHIAGLSSNATLWVATGPFKKGVSLPVVADVPFFPMSPSGILAIEINVRPGYNDQVSVIAAGGGSPAGNLYITQISRGA